MNNPPSWMSQAVALGFLLLPVFLLVWTLLMKMFWPTPQQDYERGYAAMKEVLESGNPERVANFRSHIYESGDPDEFDRGCRDADLDFGHLVETENDIA